MALLMLIPALALFLPALLPILAVLGSLFAADEGASTGQSPAAAPAAGSRQTDAGPTSTFRHREVRRACPVS